jgi:phosphate transport system permease protein
MTPFPQAHSAPSLFDRGTLFFKPSLGRNLFNYICTSIAGLFATIAVLPLVLVLLYVLVQGGRLITPSLLTQLPPAPGMSGGGIGNAIIGTVVVTLIAALLAIPIGVGGGIS